MRTARYLILVTVGLALATSPGCLSKPQRPAFYVVGRSVIGKLDPLNGGPTIWKEDDFYYLHGPALSPDAQRVCYFSCVSDQACNLWVAKVDGQEEHFLAGPFIPLLYAFPTSLQWSADGKHIAFRAKVTEKGGENGIYILSADTGEVIYSLVGTDRFAWAPSSARMALLWRGRNPPTENGLYVFDVASGEETHILQNDTDRFLDDVIWLGGEDRFLVVAHNTGLPSIYRAYTVSIDDRSLEEVPVHRGLDAPSRRYLLSPCAASDGRWVAFGVSYSLLNGELPETGIVVINLDTGSEQELDFPMRRDMVCSPYSQHILSGCNVGLGLPSKICLVSLNDGKVSEIMSNESLTIEDLSW